MRALVDLARVTAPPLAGTFARSGGGQGGCLDLAISVIVPTKNERRNLPRLLTSLPPDVELVLCDASDDGTPEIARLLRSRNTQVLSVDGSIAAARQAGAEASRGDLLVFSDADVTFAPPYFERLAAVFCGPASTPRSGPRLPILSPASQERGIGRSLPSPAAAGEGPGEGGAAPGEVLGTGGCPEAFRRFRWDAVAGAKLSLGPYARYYRLVVTSQRLTYALAGISAASGSNMALTRQAFQALGGFRGDLRCNEDTELFLRAGRRGLRVYFDPELVVWATDHRRLHRGLVRKSLHSLVRNVLIFAVCTRPGMPRLLVHDWGYWSAPARRPPSLDTL